VYLRHAGRSFGAADQADQNQKENR
jgi:hypothetical protein